MGVIPLPDEPLPDDATYPVEHVASALRRWSTERPGDWCIVMGDVSWDNCVREFKPAQEQQTGPYRYPIGISVHKDQSVEPNHFRIVRRDILEAEHDAAATTNP